MPNPHSQARYLVLQLHICQPTSSKQVMLLIPQHSSSLACTHNRQGGGLVNKAGKSGPEVTTPAC